MELEKYLSEDAQFRMANRSIVASASMSKNQSELMRAKRRGNFILRQELKNYTPECSIKCIIIFHSLCFLIFLGFGISFSLTPDIIQYEIEYTSCSLREATVNGTVTKLCTQEISLNQTMAAPIYVYYRLDNFFTNHREYARSKVWAQLRGEETFSYYYDSYCEGMRYNQDLFGNNTKKMVSFTGKPLNASATLDPCGYIARSFFTDTYTLAPLLLGSPNIPINQTGVANWADREFMFKPNPSPDLQWIDVTDEHFMVWMNMETFADFRKKWGHIDQDLEPMTYKLTIYWNWEVNDYGTRKYVIFSTAPAMGTSNFFGYALLFAAFLSLCTIIYMIYLKCIYEHIKFNPEKMNWD